MLGIFAITLAVFGSAFSVKNTIENGGKLTSLYWFTPGVTTQSQSTVDVATTADEESNVCPGSGVACKDGYTSVQTSGSNYVAQGTATTINKQ